MVQMPFNILFDNKEMFWYLFLILGLGIIIVFDFVKMKLMPQELKRRRKTKIWIFISRSLIITLLIISLASPYFPKVTETQGNPRVTLLVDKSNSMSTFNTEFINTFKEQLDKEVPVNLREFGSAENSNLGQAILENIEQGGSIVVISDGNVNKGSSLEDVALYAGNMNASISVINLTPKQEEFSVVINGPSKIVADSEEIFFVKVTGTANKEVKLVVTNNDKKIIDELVYPGVMEFKLKLGEGNHQLQATINVNDANPDNNKFYKTVHSLRKPKVLLVTQTKNSGIEKFLKQLYSVETKTFVDEKTDLSPYYAVVLYDLPEEKIAGVQNLNNYLLDEKGAYYGNGLVVIGGLNSFDKGGYSTAPVRTLLPVSVGKGKRKTGDDNLVFIIGLTGGVSGTKYVKQEDGSYLEVKDEVPVEAVMRSQAIAAIEQLRIDNKVGAIAFGITETGHSDSIDEAREKTVVKLEDIDYLYNNRKKLIEDITNIRGGGPYNLDIAFREAIDMLKDKSGNKHIILLTDGRFCAGFGSECREAKNVLNQISNIKKMGISVMTIGVGPTKAEDFPKKVDELFLKELAKSGDGTYDRATQLQTLMIKWGDPEAKKYGEEFRLVPLSLTHFITRDLEFSSTLNGFNQVVPKDNAELLITNDGGQPALTTWRYGNGRVATWTVFRANGLGGLLNEDSEVMTRTTNWAIGDPERKESYLVTIDDARTNEETKIIVKSETPISVEGLEFAKSGDYYESDFLASKTGFSTMLNTLYAINNPSEYDEVGFNKQLTSLAQITGGKLFAPNQIEEIAKHAKEVSRKVTLDKKYFQWPFIVLAIIIFLIEVYIRKLSERKRR